MARTAVSQASKVPAARRWVTVVALLAFFLQSLVVQTHIHQPVQALAPHAASAHVPAPLKSPDPIDQCRLCQELVHAGAFVTPSASVTLASLALATAIFTASPLRLVSLARAFSWQSRAPPRR
jgi:hypothetical protein